MPKPTPDYDPFGDEDEFEPKDELEEEQISEEKIDELPDDDEYDPYDEEDPDPYKGESKAVSDEVIQPKTEADIEDMTEEFNLINEVMAAQTSAPEDVKPEDITLESVTAAFDEMKKLGQEKAFVLENVIKSQTSGLMSKAEAYAVIRKLGITEGENGWQTYVGYIFFNRKVQDVSKKAGQIDPYCFSCAGHGLNLDPTLSPIAHAPTPCKKCYDHVVGEDNIITPADLKKLMPVDFPTQIEADPPKAVKWLDEPCPFNTKKKHIWKIVSLEEVVCSRCNNKVTGPGFAEELAGQHQVHLKKYMDLGEVKKKTPKKVCAVYYTHHEYDVKEAGVEDILWCKCGAVDYDDIETSAGVCTKHGTGHEWNSHPTLKNTCLCGMQHPWVEKPKKPIIGKTVAEVALEEQATAVAIITAQNSECPNHTQGEHQWLAKDKATAKCANCNMEILATGLVQTIIEDAAASPQKTKFEAKTLLENLDKAKFPYSTLTHKDFTPGSEKVFGDMKEAGKSMAKGVAKEVEKAALGLQDTTTHEEIPSEWGPTEGIFYKSQNWHIYRVTPEIVEIGSKKSGQEHTGYARYFKFPHDWHVKSVTATYDLNNKLKGMGIKIIEDNGYEPMSLTGESLPECAGIKHPVYCPACNGWGKDPKAGEKPAPICGTCDGTGITENKGLVGMDYKCQPCDGFGQIAWIIQADGVQVKKTCKYCKGKGKAKTPGNYSQGLISGLYHPITGVCNVCDGKNGFLSGYGDWIQCHNCGGYGNNKVLKKALAPMNPEIIVKDENVDVSDAPKPGVVKVKSAGTFGEPDGWHNEKDGVCLRFGGKVMIRITGDGKVILDEDEHFLHDMSTPLAADFVNQFWAAVGEKNPWVHKYNEAAGKNEELETKMHKLYQILGKIALQGEKIKARTEGDPMIARFRNLADHLGA